MQTIRMNIPAGMSGTLDLLQDILDTMTDRTQMTQITDGVNEADVIAIINSLKTDLSSIAGTVTSVNTGNVDAGTLRVTIADDDTNLSWIADAIAVHLGAGPANAMLTGALAIDGVPDEETAGDIASPWMDLFRRLVIFGADLAVGALSITDVSPAQMQKMFETGWVALDTPGQFTPARDVRDYENITVAYIIDFGGCTDVDLIAWGTLDEGANWFPIWADNITTAEDNPDAVMISSVALTHVRCEFENEAGDTDATVVFQLGAGN